MRTSINCSRDRVYQDMLDTKRRWGKEGRKRKGYHIIQSFAPGEVTPDQAHSRALRHWGGAVPTPAGRPL